MDVSIEHTSGSCKGRIDRFEGEAVLIGRGAGNDLAFDPFVEAVVSTHHAEIRRENGDHVLYDMGSLNGTYLNGASVRRAVLGDGDEIGLGRHGPRLRFARTGAALPAEPPAAVVKTTLRTRAEELPPRIDEQITSRDWRFWVVVLATVSVSIAAFTLVS